MKVVEEEARIRVMEGAWTPEGVMKEVVAGGQEDPFYVMDVGEVVARYQHWRDLMPRVEPFYAVKCNDDKVLVRVLAALGSNFDCASKGEIELVTSLGVSPDRIIFANPAKMSSHIRYASAVGVDTMTFDSETELMKIKQIMPHAKLVIRIRCDAADAQCPLGIKFGCDPVSEAPRLLKLAAVLGLDVVGVSFHVGSGAQDSSVYARAIEYCHALFSLGACVGHAGMALLDLGGGFPGNSGTSIVDASKVINEALARFFPDPSVRVIAEPGRYFAAAAYTLATMVHSKREVVNKEDPEHETHTMYFVNDGVYGSFNCILYDHQTVYTHPLYPSSEKQVPCSVWGPTCDGLDCVLPAARLPALALGEWLVWRDMGAYTLPVASPFNGYPVPSVRYVMADKLRPLLKELSPLLEAPWAASPPPSPPSERADVLAPPRAVFVECAIK
ncbi:ornithine decarboxylase 1-like [Pectinophora gossypiella]|uniref:ornithine decarboxylase 1-like n=1 Tax=Pectinophora gossypiella TaxID=13191 RepID=UPI00214F124D|nr:ornithine decarboxylase 1-like [Pectinophora gossypiella]